MSEWRSDETLAWTERDGLPPPPNGANHWFLGSLALSMGAVWIALLASDTLCPEHRAWVEVFATVALASAVAAVVGLVGHRAWASLTALASALLGVAVGFIDAVHSPTRGALTALSFAVVAIGVLVAAVPQLRSAFWFRRARAELISERVQLANDRAEMADPASGATGAEHAVESPSPQTPRRSRSHAPR
jgi:hypothetical protein